MVPSVLCASVLLVTLWAPGSGSSPGGASCVSGSACPTKEEEDLISALQFSKAQVSKVEPETELGAEATRTTEAVEPVECQPKREYCKQLCSAISGEWACQYLCLFRWKSIKRTMHEYCDSCCQDSSCQGSAASLAVSAQSEGGAGAEADLTLEDLAEPGVEGSAEASQQVLDYLRVTSSGLAEEEVSEEVLGALEGVEASWCSDWSKWCTPLCKALSWPSKGAQSECEESCSGAAAELAPIFHAYCKAGVCQKKGWPWASSADEDVLASDAISSALD